MYYTYKNTIIKLNNKELAASSATVSLENFDQATYENSNRYSFEYAPIEGTRGSLSLDYFITGDSDPLKDFIADETTVISGNFGGLFFESGYLESYSLQGGAHAPVAVNANIVFFEDLQGTFTPTYETVEEQPILNFTDAQVTNSSVAAIGSVTNLTDIEYNFKAQVQPYYWETPTGRTEIRPSHVGFLEKTVDLSITSDNLQGDLPLEGETAIVSLALKSPVDGGTVETYSVNGPLFKRVINATAGQTTKSILSAHQTFVNEQVPTISSFTSNGYTGDSIVIEGTNMENIIAVRFNGEKTPSFAASSTSITAIIPSGAFTGKIKVEGYDGSVESSTDLTVNQFDLNISDVDDYTGVIGSNILVHGSNFHRVSEVYFNESAPANFDIISGVRFH